MKSNPRITALRDITLIIVSAIAIQALIYPFYWRFASLPAAITVLVLASLMLRQQGVGWHDIGLRGPSSLRGIMIIIGQILLALMVMIGVGAGASLYLGQFIEPSAPAGDRFEGIVGDVRYYIFLVAVSWLVGGFAEEMVFRGFLINRVDTLFTGRFPMENPTLTTMISVVVPALMFGFAHLYWRGLLGALVGSCVGIALGILYLAFGRRLWPLIIAHGSLNTLSITARFFDADI